MMTVYMQSESEVVITSPRFVALHHQVSEMYCLRLFVLQQLHCLLQRLLKLLWCVPLKRVCIPSSS